MSKGIGLLLFLSTSGINLWGQSTDLKVNRIILEVIDSLIINTDQKVGEPQKKYAIIIEAFKLNQECFIFGEHMDNRRVEAFYTLKGKFRFSVVGPVFLLAKTPTLFFSYKNACISLYTGMENLFEKRIVEEKQYRLYLEKNFGRTIKSQPGGLQNTWLVEIDEFSDPKFKILPEEESSDNKEDR